MENTPQNLVISHESNRLAMGLAATVAAAGVLLVPTSAHAAEESTDGRTSHAIEHHDSGYRFSPGVRMPDLDEGVFSPVVIHATLPLQERNMPFAPDFSRSTNALEVSPSDVGNVMHRLQGMTGLFLGDIKVEVQGSASAEDSRTAADAGVGEPSVDNVRLANDRAKSFAAELEDQLEKSGKGKLKHADVIVKPGVEQVLNHHEVAELGNFAHDNGYADIRTMVVDFNQGNANHAATERLNDLLVPQRGVRVTISGDIPVVPALPTVESPKNFKEPTPETEKIKIAPGVDKQIPKATTADGSKFPFNESLAGHHGLTPEDLLGLSGLALGAGIRRRRDENPLKVVPLTVPTPRPTNPDEFEIVSEK